MPYLELFEKCSTFLKLLENSKVEGKLYAQMDDHLRTLTKVVEKHNSMVMVNY